MCHHQRRTGLEPPPDLCRHRHALLARHKVKSQQARGAIEWPSRCTLHIATVQRHAVARHARALQPLRGQVQHGLAGVHAVKTPAGVRQRHVFQLQPAACAHHQHAAVGGHALSQQDADMRSRLS
jgi:hypothetical protein